MDCYSTFKSTNDMKKIKRMAGGLSVILTTLVALPSQGQTDQLLKLNTRPNLAVVATPVSSLRGGFNSTALNDGIAIVFPPNPRAGGSGGNNRAVPPRQNLWIQYEWAQPVSTKEMAVYWWDYNKNIRLPEAYHIQYWNGTAFVPVANPKGMGSESNQLNITSFDEVKTTKLRLELDSADRGLQTLLEWMVYKTDNSPDPAPLVN
ncbi:MAG: hypothetical protein EOP42_24655, partial [Sphingobacteriaceae bacterium]